MSDSHPFDFTPVAVRARRDGWTADVQARFIELLAAGCGPSEAAAAVGKSKQTAYALRTRPGAESFAAAWDAACAYAQGQRVAAAPPRAVRQALDGVLVPRFYRGRLVSVERRYPSGGLVRALAQLDRWAEKPRTRGGEELSFDQLLDLIAPRPKPPKRKRSGRGRTGLDRLLRRQP